MAQIIERNRKDGSVAYLAQIAIKRKGKWVHRESRTFDKRRAAEAWHKKRMKEIDALGDDLTTLSNRDQTLKAAITKYLEDSGDAIGSTKTQVLETIRDEYDIANMEADEIQSVDIVDFLKLIAARDTVQCPSTVLNYASHLAAVFRIAKPAWGIPLDRQKMSEAMDAAKRLGITRKSQSRNRRPTLDELDALLNHFEQAHIRRPKSMPMHRIIGFALFSSRRQEEITRLSWDGIDTEHSRVFITDMKHPGDKMGNDVWCDLPEPALKIALAMPRETELVFPYKSKTISTHFARACKVLGIVDLRFHDLRHEAISRLFEMGLSIPQAAAVSGHRSWSSLQRYTHIRQRGDKYADWEWIDRLARSEAPRTQKAPRRG